MNRTWLIGLGVAGVALVTAILTLTRGGAIVRGLVGEGAPRATEAAVRRTAQSMTSGPSAATPPPRWEVTIDPRRQQLIGVRTALVRRAPISMDVRAVGTVRYDETRQAEINAKVDGWIRELHADYTGKSIRQGDPLFALYSPDLATTQNEYLLALRGHSQAARGDVPAVRDYSDRLVQAARERLLRWDFTAEDIQQLDQRGRATDTVTFRSPVGGVVVEKAAVLGMRVKAGQMLFRVADLSSVWVEADVYEQDMALVRVGQSATVALDAYPGETFAGRATYVYPAVDEKTRTAKVRFQFANGRGRLKPGMYATVQLARHERTGLTIPIDAPSTRAQSNSCSLRKAKAASSLDR